MLPPLVVLPDRFELLDRFLPGAIDMVFASPRAFAGRGRVRGLGDWPHLFNYALSL